MRALILSIVLAASGGVALATPDAGAKVVAVAPAPAPDAAPDGVAAPAAPVVPDVAADTGGYAKEVFTAVTKKNWKYLAALILIALVSLTRKYGPKSLSTGKAAWASAVGLGVAGAIGTGLAAGLGVKDALDPQVLINGATNGLIAAGLWKGWNEWKPATPPPVPPA